MEQVGHFPLQRTDSIKVEERKNDVDSEILHHDHIFSPTAHFYHAYFLHRFLVVENVLVLVIE